MVSFEKAREKPLKQIMRNNVPDKEFKALVIRMLTELAKRIEEHSGILISQN